MKAATMAIKRQAMAVQREVRNSLDTGKFSTSSTVIVKTRCYVGQGGQRLVDRIWCRSRNKSSDAGWARIAWLPIFGRAFAPSLPCLFR